MSGGQLEKFEDWVFEAGRRRDLKGTLVRGAILGSVGAFYIVGSLGMQAGRVVMWAYRCFSDRKRDP